MVLEEVQVPPRERLEIVRLARPPALRAGDRGTTVRLKHELENKRSLARRASFLTQCSD